MPLTITGILGGHIVLTAPGPTPTPTPAPTPTPTPAPTITLNAFGSTQFVQDGASVAIVTPTATLANYTSAPTIQAKLDSGSFAAVSGWTISTTAASGNVSGVSGGTHTLQLRDGNGVQSNTLSFYVEEALFGLQPPTTGTQGVAITGTTANLYGLTTAFAQLFAGSSAEGSRASFSGSNPVTVPSLTPATVNANYTIKLFDAASSGNLLRTSTAINVAAPTPTPTPTGTPVQVDSFSVQNWNSSATSPGYHEGGVMFAQGAVPAGTSLTLKDGSGATIPSQFHSRAAWPDGSLQFAGMLLRDSDLAASETRAYRIWTAPGVAWNDTGSLTLAQALSGHDPKVTFANIRDNAGQFYSRNNVGTDSGNTTDTTTTSQTTNSSTHVISDMTTVTRRNNSDNSVAWIDTYTYLTYPPGATGATQGSGAMTASLAAHAAVATRVEKYVSGPVKEAWLVWGMATDDTGGAADAHLKVNWYVEAWKAADGSVHAVEVAPVVAQDWWSIANKRTRLYDATFLDGTTTLGAYSGVQHGCQQQWIACQNNGDNNRGRPFCLGGAQSTLLYLPNRANWRASKVIPPMDTTLGVPSDSYAVGGSRNGDETGNTAYLPCRGQNHREGIDATGAYMGRGLVPNTDAMAFARQTAPDWAAARINWHAGLHVLFHYRSNRTRTKPGDTSADTANTPISLIMDRSSHDLPAYDFQGDGLPVPVDANADDRTPSNAIDGFVQPTGLNWWGVGTHNSSHAANYCGMGYVWECKRYHLEALIDHALNGALQEIAAFTQLPSYFSGTEFRAKNPPSDTYGAIANLTTQERATGWAINLVGWAAALTPATNVSRNMIRRFAKQQAIFCQGILDYTPDDLLAAGQQSNVLSAGNGVNSPWMCCIAAMGMLHAGNLTGEAALTNYGKALANQAVRNVTQDPYLTVAYRGAPLMKTSTGYNPTGNPVIPTGGSLIAGAVVCNVDHTTGVLTPFAGFGPFGVAFQNGDAWTTCGPFFQAAVPNLPPSEIPEGTVVYLVNVQTNAPNIPFQVSLTPGGSPVTFAGDTPVGFSVDMQAWRAMTVAANPPRLPNSDDYPTMALATLAMAHDAGHSGATTALYNKQRTFLSGVNFNPWRTWSFAPITS